MQMVWERSFTYPIDVCSCPQGIKYDVTNEPFANVTVDQINQEDDQIEMTGIHAPIKLGKVNIRNKQIAEILQSRDLNSALYIILLVQVAACMGICMYCGKRIDKQQHRERAQRAEFTDFIYNYHKQMSEDNEDGYAAFGANGETPGAPPQRERANTNEQPQGN